MKGTAMHLRRTAIRLIAAPVLLCAILAAAQTPPRPAAPAHPPLAPYAAGQSMPSDKDVVASQHELIRLLRLSPTLTTVVAHDPSLLSDSQYVAHNNPQLADFLAAHPEVARNPDFYLFSHLNHDDGSPDEALERAVWPDVYRASAPRGPFADFISNMPPLLAFAFFLIFAVWIVRLFTENRRWNRIFKLQSEVHGRLIDKFSTTQELASYMETDAGKRFLEASPIPVNFEQDRRVPNAVARVLTPLQIGIVLVLLGTGLLLLRHAGPDMDSPMLVLGTVTMMPGIGFIISAGITWLLAARLGLMPDGAAHNKFDPPYGASLGSKDRQ